MKLGRKRKLLKHTLLRLFGTGAPLIFGDSMVLDRWRWLKRYLPESAGQELLIDIGCGTGAFTVAAANRGYTSLGLTWNERDQVEAQWRAEALRLAERATFELFDVRKLDQFKRNTGEWCYVICCENIEHIIDDAKLIRDIVKILKPGGRLLMTTPNYYYRPLNEKDKGPFEPIEDGRHVKRGYSSAELYDLLEGHGLSVEKIEYCSGFFSQLLTALLRALSPLPAPLVWVATLPLRILVLVLDRPTGDASRPGYSICVVAIKPRFPQSTIRS